MTTATTNMATVVLTLTEPDESADNLKQKVNDMTAYCRKRSSTLISHIQEGYDNDWWQIDKLRAGLK